MQEYEQRHLTQHNGDKNPHQPHDAINKHKHNYKNKSQKSKSFKDIRIDLWNHRFKKIPSSSSNLPRHNITMTQKDSMCETSTTFMTRRSPMISSSPSLSKVKFKTSTLTVVPSLKYAASSTTTATTNTATTSATAQNITVNHTNTKESIAHTRSDTRLATNKLNHDNPSKTLFPTPLPRHSASVLSLASSSRPKLQSKSKPTNSITSFSSLPSKDGPGQGREQGSRRGRGAAGFMTRQKHTLIVPISHNETASCNTQHLITLEDSRKRLEQAHKHVKIK